MFLRLHEITEGAQSCYFGEDIEQQALAPLGVNKYRGASKIAVISAAPESGEQKTQYLDYISIEGSLISSISNLQLLCCDSLCNFSYQIEKNRIHGFYWQIFREL